MYLHISTSERDFVSVLSYRSTILHSVEVWPLSLPTATAVYSIAKDTLDSGPRPRIASDSRGHVPCCVVMQQTEAVNS